MVALTIFVALLAGLASWVIAHVVLSFLVARRVLDRPNDRSSHDRPVPRGGGIAVIVVVLPLWLALAAVRGSLAATWPVLLAAALLALLSFVDDVRTLSPLPRFAGHIAAVLIGVLLLPSDAYAFGGLLPLWLDHLVLGVAWLWFVNLYNFMDGIDGITGVETITVAGGVAVVALISGGGPDAPAAAALAGAAAGFLVLNWHPARIFLGDVGSVPLGYLTGFLLVHAAALQGWWWLALILPLYYWADATTTLLMRLLSGQRIWQAHRSHAYQVAVQRGLSHAAVVWVVAGFDGGLLLLCLAVAGGLLGPWPAAVTGAALTIAALCYLRLRRGVGDRG